MLNSFLEHSENEAEFFILLVLLGRAGTQLLKKRFEDRIKEMLSKRMKIKDRVGHPQTVSETDRDRFYSHWVYGAIHVLVSIERLQTIEAIAKATGFHHIRVKDDLDFLVRIGLVKRDGARYKIGPKSIHLDADSPAIAKHHSNWRYHTVQSVFNASSDDLHFSSAVSLDERAVRDVREVLLKSLEKNLTTIKKAREEMAYVMNFDFYRLG